MAPSRSILSLSLPKDAISLLTTAGYETLADLSHATTESLVQEIAERILAVRGLPGTIPPSLPATQSAAILAQASETVPTGCSALDKLLQGGIRRGHIVELSGPPGSPKELTAMSATEQFAGRGDDIILIDCQSMLDRRFLRDLSRRATMSTMRYAKLQTLPQFILFISQLPKILGTSPKNTLLVISSISSLFQATELTAVNRTAILQKLKQSLANLTLTNKLTVITTSQLATKMLNPDGSPGTFDSGAHGIMVPQLGSAYLPSGKSWRIIFSPDSQTSGVMKLLSSPQFPENANGPILKEPYSTCRQVSSKGT